MRPILVRPASILFLLLFILPDRLASWVKSALLACHAGWRDFFVHHSAYIHGIDFIRVAPGFRAGRGFWMQAIYSYNNVSYAPRLAIGLHFGCSDYVHIACSSCVEIGHHVLVGSHVLITDHMHGNYSGTDAQSQPSSPPIARVLAGKSVRIGDCVFIGDSVRILPGSDIGSGCIIACNSVVNSTLPANSICGGTPAKPIKLFDESSNQWNRA